jgi:predicted small lipoprotein YifL
MRSLRVFALLALAAVVSGCGNKGPLVLPAQPQAPAAAASAPAPASTAAAPAVQP